MTEYGGTQRVRAASCCFTGHRPEKLPWGTREKDPQCVALKQQMQTEIKKAYESGIRHFITGMARGTDQYFCEAVLAVRKQYPDVTLEAAIPFTGQADRWKPEEKNRYRALLEQCDFETVVSHNYDRGCMQRRNRYLVDHASYIIAAYNGKGGGTMYTLSYAMKQGLAYIILDI